jgi:hypothetical protein
MARAGRKAYSPDRSSGDVAPQQRLTLSAGPAYRPCMPPLFRLILASLTLLAMLAVPGEAAGQEPEQRPFIIEFPDADFVERIGIIRAFMGLTECGSVDLSAGERILVVGGPGTPPECNQTWRVVNLVPDESSPLFNDPVFQPGGRITLTNVAPFPAVDGSPYPFFIEIRVDGEGMRESDLVPYRSLTAFVHGVECGSTSLLNVEEGLVTVPVGAPGTPDVCRERGAEIILVYGNGLRLIVRPTIGPGPFYALKNLAPEPIPTGSPAPSSTGYGLTDDESTNRTFVVVALLSLVIALAVAGRRLSQR